MKLYNFNDLYLIAESRGFKALGSYNVHCLEMLPAYFAAAKKTNSPLMLQISTGTAKYVGFDLLVDAVKSLSESTDVPVSLHLDHCSDLDSIKLSIAKGFSSVMYDGSDLSLSENIKNTNKIIDFARPFNVSVEAELGAIGGAEDGKAVAVEDIAFTRPEDAKRFVSETDVDLLAVSIGTVHGSYTAKVNIQHELLTTLREITGKPLVLHGGTGVSDEDMRSVLNKGIKKVNVGTEMNVQWVNACQKSFAAGKVDDSVRNFFIPASEAVEKVLIEKMNLFK